MNFKEHLKTKAIEASNATMSDFLAYKGVESEGLEANKAAELYDEFQAFMRSELELRIESKATKADIEALKSHMSEQQEKQVESLMIILKNQGTLLNDLQRKKAGGTNGEVAMGFSSQLVSKLRTDQSEAFKAWKDEGKQFKMSLDMKAVADMTSANISGGDVPQAQRLPGFDIVPSRVVRVMQLCQQRTSSSNKVEWVYQSGQEGAAGQTGEGLAKNQIDFNIVVDSEDAKKTTAFIKVTTEMLNDITWLESEIRAELTREVLKAIEAQVYEGDGTGNNQNGIRTVASAFSAGASALAVDNANYVDVLNVAITQILIAQEGEARPNYILMHPEDVLILKQVKVSATDKRYVDMLYYVGDTMYLGTIPIIESTLVTQDEYLIGDFNMAEFITHKSMEVMMGLDADDFTKNLRTIIAEWRGMTVVRTNRRSAFVAGVFSTDMAALETA